MASRKFTVLHLITRLDPGGSASNTIVSVDRLRKHGFDCILGVGRTEDPDGLIRRNLDSLQLEHIDIPDLLRTVAPVSDIRAYRAIRRILATRHIDLVHTHTSKAGALGRMAARAAGIPVVHTPHGHVFHGYFNPLSTHIFIAIERYLAHSTARIISLTDLETGQSLAVGIGQRSQYVTIHSGVPLAHFRDIPDSLGLEFRARHAIPTDAFLVVSIGRLVPIKAHHILIEALARLPSNLQAWLAIAGEGESRTELENLADRLKVRHRLILAGEQADVRPILSSARAFALASRNEGMGRVFVEAMTAGVPVIGTSVGGVPSLIRDGITGLLVPPDDAASMAAAITRLANTPSLCENLVHTAKSAVDPEYDEGTMIQNLAAVYRDVLGAPAP